MLASLLHSSRALHPLRRLTLCAASLAAAVSLSSSTRAAAPFSQIIVFGDSLSDTGNFAHQTRSKYGVTVPGSSTDYADGRFTSSGSTTPGSGTYSGVWHEQLAKRFLGLPTSNDSLDGGTDYAFGSATTEDGTQQVSLGDGLSITIDNMGQQVTNFLAKGPADANALFIVWGGGNDLFADDSAASVSATAQRVGALVTRLAQGGGRTFVVPNVPPLGAVPSRNTTSGAAALNAASASYRDQLNGVLDSTVASLGAQGISVNVIRLDVYALFEELVGGPASYGFTDVTDAAQGMNVNVDSTLFWDGIHPTTAGHSQIAQDAADLLPGGHPAFFNGEALLGGGDFGYLAFANGQRFGYYSYQYFPYLYSSDLGFEYFVDAGDSQGGAYLYDFGLQTFLYTSPALYPNLFNFNANAFYYYFAGTTAPRVFYNFATKQYVYSSN